MARVLDVARKLDYRPNSLARGLRLNRTFTVGMLIPDLTNPLFPPIARGIEDRLARDGYTLVLANTSYDPERERAIVDLIGRRVDGLLLATAELSYPLLDELVAAGLPIVLVNRVTDDPPVPSVTGDDHAGIGLAVRHLAGLGHRRIAYVGGTRTFSTGLFRYQAFVSWIQSEGLELDPALIEIAPRFSQEPGREACMAILERARDVTAVVAGNDLMALGCYRALGHHGLRVPEDVSVTGYNDSPFSENFAPPLT
ncbi:MAG: LacI family DNA-binding transcriptional regulator, partial [Solirubrobacteraceae bacterium]